MFTACPRTKDVAWWIQLSCRRLMVWSIVLICSVRGVWPQEMIGTIDQAGLQPFAMAVYETGQKLCVYDREHTQLFIYDEKSLQLLNQIALPCFWNSGVDMAVDEKNARLYIGRNQRLAIVDLAANSLLKDLIFPIRGSYGFFQNMSFDETLRKIFVLLSTHILIYDIPGDSCRYYPFPSLGLRSHLAVNPVTHEAFICNLHEDHMDILDGRTEVLSRLPAIPGRAVCINWQENKVYLTHVQWGGYWLINRNTGWSGYLSLVCDATWLSYNPAVNRIFSNAEFDNRMVIIEADDSMSSLPMISSGPQIRHKTSHLYFATGDFIGVLDGAGLAIQLMSLPNYDYIVPVMSGAVNQGSGRVYFGLEYDRIVVLQDRETLMRPHMLLGDERWGIVWSLDPNSKEVLHEDPFSNLGLAAAVKPGAGKIYTSRGTIIEGCGPHADEKTFSRGTGSSSAVPVVSPDGSLLYISNPHEDQITVLDTESDSALYTLPTGDYPAGMAVTQSMIYVANQTENTVWALSPFTRQRQAIIPVGKKPWGIAVNPAETKAYVSNAEANTVSVIDLVQHKVSATIPVGAIPHKPVFSRDGAFVFIPCSGSNQVAIMNAGTDQVLKTVTVDLFPEGLAAVPTRDEVYVGCENRYNVITVPEFSVTSHNLNPKTIPRGSPYKINTLVIADPTARFAGRILNSAKNPAAGILVRALQNGVEQGRAVTNASGDYCVCGLTPGWYDIECSGAGITAQTFSPMQGRSGQTTLLHVPNQTRVTSDDQAPMEMNLRQNYPNPFNEKTTIEYTLPQETMVELVLWAVDGRMVKKVIHSRQPAGPHRLLIDSKELSAGVYFYQLKTSSFSLMKKMIYLR